MHELPDRGMDAHSPLLRISPTGTEEDPAHFALTYSADGKTVESFAQVPQLLSPEDQESIRWYLEEYRNFPFNPADLVAQRVSARLEEIGMDLFEHVFGKNRVFWNLVKLRIQRTRIEIENHSSRFTIPWELLRDPLDTLPVRCRAASYVRTIADRPAGQSPSPAGILRVLLVISRPAGARDVPLRSVASRIMDRVGADTRFRFRVLRPPTLAALQETLDKAYAEGDPYRIVHFDGHGVHEDIMAKVENRRERKRKGYLLLEGPSGQAEYVDGRIMGAVLAAGRVPILILNACRSARSEEWDDRLGQRRAFGSLAEEVMSSANTAVVAMQYNVDVATAAHFVAILYEQLANRRALGEAVREGVRSLFQDQKPRPGADQLVQDWVVPVLFEAFPVMSLLDETQDEKHLEVSRLTQTAPVPLIGGDDTLMAIERAFQRAPIVFLTGQVGSGKSALAAEFASWVSRTSERPGQTLFLSTNGLRGSAFLPASAKEFRPEDRAAGTPAQSGSTWSMVGPGLVVLDDLPSLTASAELEGFLAEMVAAERRVLVISRALGPLSIGMETVNVVPLDMSERIQLIRTALDNPIQFDLDAWRPVFEFSQGNPAVLHWLAAKMLGTAMKPADLLRTARAEPTGIGPKMSGLLDAAFHDGEMDCLAVATLFEGAVSAKTLQMITETDHQTVASGKGITSMLDRLCDHGLATEIGSGYYRMHPGLPGLLHPEFTRRYQGSRRDRVLGLWVTLHSAICAIFHRNFDSGRPNSHDVSLQTLSLIEPTLCRVFDEARSLDRWEDVRNLVAALRLIMIHEGRNQEWRRLADGLWKDAADALTADAIQGREALWYLLQTDRVDRLFTGHSLAEASLLEERAVRELREDLTEMGSGREAEFFREALIRRLLVLGDIRAEQRLADAAADSYVEAIEIAQRYGMEHEEHMTACRMALLHLFPERQDFKLAQYWLHYASDLASTLDRMAQANLRYIAGRIAFAHSHVAQFQAEIREGFLATASNCFKQALVNFPTEPSKSRAECEIFLAQAVFDRFFDITEALNLVHAAIASHVAREDVYHASLARLDAARMLLRAEDRRRAGWYAKEAARGFASLSGRAEVELEICQQIEGHIQTEGRN
jgi:hypothetical protein